jgi:hypothetical protein
MWSKALTKLPTQRQVPAGPHRRRSFKRNARWGVYDFSTLYTTLPHDDDEHGLIQRMGKLLRRIFDTKKRQWLVISFNSAKEV